MLQAYKNFWKGYVDFETPIDRKEFWLEFFGNLIVSSLFIAISFLIGMPGGMIFFSFYFVATAIPLFSSMARRLLDAGRSRAHLLWFFASIVGWIVLLCLLCQPTNEAMAAEAKAKKEMKEQQGKLAYQKAKSVTYTADDAVADILTLTGNANLIPNRKVTSADVAKAALVNELTGISQLSSPKTQSVTGIDPIKKQHYLFLADQYAHEENLFADNPKKKELENQLLAGGRNALEGITGFLMSCGKGQVNYGWWNGAAGLTCMLRKIGGNDAEAYLLRLKNLSTNIWEYHTQVKETAEKELLELKKASGDYGKDGRIPAEFAHAELLTLQNVSPPEKRLENCFAMKDSVDGWSNADKAFYYFIAGGASRVLFPTNRSNLAFYAAQVFSDPNPTSMGWNHLKEVEGNDLQTDMESAKRLHEKYPLPKSMEEAKTYVYGMADTSIPKEDKDVSYSLDQGLKDLMDLFRDYPKVDRAKVQEVGQKIYDAKIPLVSGVGGMHQLYVRFMERMPMYGPELSRIWDGIGDWAD